MSNFSGNVTPIPKPKSLKKAVLKNKLDRLPYWEVNALAGLKKDFVAWLPGGRHESGEYTVCSPLRPDNRPGSFKINGAKGLWIDFATNEGGNLIQLYARINNITDAEACIELANRYGINLESGYSSILPQHPRHGVPSKVYPYFDETGNGVAFYVYRFDLEDGRKTFSQVRVNEYGNWVWEMRTFRGLRPLYNLHQVIKNPRKRIIFAEGEKAVDACTKLFPDAVATTVSEGSNAKLEKTDFTPLKDRTVLIWPDFDGVGEKFAKRVKDKLKEVGAAEVKILDVPPANGHEYPETWDAADALQAGWTSAKAQQLGFIEDQDKQGQPIFESITGAELYAKEFPPIKWIVPRLLPEGLALLCGKAKLGKSWLSLSIAIAVSKGGAALSYAPVQKGEVLFLSLEDGERQLQQRQKILTKDAAHELKDLHFVNECPRIGNGFRTMLVNWLEQNPKTRLVVVDTLSKILPLKQSDKNLFLSDHDLISSLKSIADRFRVGLLIVHHLRKQESTDSLDAIAGTGGLVAGASTTMVLRRERGQADAFMYVTGKEVVDQDLAMQFDQENASWRILGDAEEFQLNSDRKEIIDALEECGPMSGNDLAEMLGKKSSTIRNMLARMERDGQVEKRGNTRNAVWLVNEGRQM